MIVQYFGYEYTIHTDLYCTWNFRLVPIQSACLFTTKHVAVTIVQQFVISWVKMLLPKCRPVIAFWSTDLTSQKCHPKAECLFSRNLKNQWFDLDYNYGVSFRSHDWKHISKQRNLNQLMSYLTMEVSKQNATISSILWLVDKFSKHCISTQYKLV